MRNLPVAILIFSLMLFAQGCQTLDTVTNVGADIFASTGAISGEQADSIKRSSKALSQAFEEFTPENEYYIGRTIAANILSRYKVYENNNAIEYVNLIGQTMAEASDKPEMFNGYHFLILDTDEINAFAAPGGLILVSRGLIRCCKYEDALAAVLAHEVGHVQLGHGMGAIQASRYTSLGKIAGVELAKNLGGEQLAQAAEIFDGTIGDIMKKMVDTGYQSSQEYDADKAAVTIMNRVGYNPMALKDMLEQMGRRLGQNSGGFGKTHPTPQSRLQNIEPLIESFGAIKTPNARKARFDNVIAGI
ncbi:MAG: peptidase M48 [Syntrophobacteraceae bacterium CG23_combo_of_CG06-09_8_20_14_all_50_8]|nr:MAG: peptidase M48 [Syntrophobacteraceae bacterium CG23_combo_of_CG06-09_8_20_14_all_50_8]